VRFLSKDKPLSVITLSVYAEAAHDGSGVPTGEYYLESASEFLTCTDPEDPGGTETWSRYEYDAETGLYPYDFTSLEESDKMARLVAESYAKTDAFFWDGEPFS
jgi:hypothetical protein